MCRCAHFNPGSLLWRSLKETCVLLALPPGWLSPTQESDDTAGFVTPWTFKAKLFGKLCCKIICCTAWFPMGPGTLVVTKMSYQQAVACEWATASMESLSKITKVRYLHNKINPYDPICIVEWDQDWEASLCCVLARHTGSPDCSANICLRLIHVRGIHVPPHDAMPDNFFGPCSWPQPCCNEFNLPNEHAWRGSRNHKTYIPGVDRFHKMSSRLEPSKGTSLRTS